MHTIQVSEEDVRDLFELIVSLGSVEDCRDLFEDLCTVNEIKQMAQRLKAAKLLMEDKTYSQVTAQTDISSATLSRVSRCVQNGKGYARLLKKAD